MPTIFWPDTLRPRDIAVDPLARTLSGGASLSGISQSVASDAGFWRVQFNNVPLSSPALVKLWRSLAGLINGRANAISLPLFDQPRAPSGTCAATVGFTDGAFSDGASFTQGGVAAFLASAAPLRATQIDVRVTSGHTLEAGQIFSVGERAHEIVSVDAYSDFDAVARYDFNAGLDGWTGFTLSAPDGGVLVITASDLASGTLLSPSFSLPGSTIKHIRLNLRRTDADPDTNWYGKCYYSTGAHGFLESFRNQPAAPQKAQNEWFALTYDMSSLTTGGTDFIDNIVTQLRFNFTSAAATWEVDWIALGLAQPRYTLSIWPPLREAQATGAQLDFTSPRVRVRLASDEEMKLPLTLNRWGFASPTFLEDV